MRKLTYISAIFSGKLKHATHHGDLLGDPGPDGSDVGVMEPFVGVAVGTRVGDSDGSKDVKFVGLEVGAVDGSMLEGAMVGLSVGVLEGSSVGEFEGDNVEGARVITTDGCVEGSTAGDIVGLSVGGKVATGEDGDDDPSSMEIASSTFWHSVIRLPVINGDDSTFKSIAASRPTQQFGV